jgi:hypothetical protein
MPWRGFRAWVRLAWHGLKPMGSSWQVVEPR